jgi:hypothetical protein
MPATPGLFANEEPTEYSETLAMPELAPDHYLEDAYDQIELLGFPLVSPFALTDWREEAAAQMLEAGKKEHEIALKTNRLQPKNEIPLEGNFTRKMVKARNEEQKVIGMGK